jgi:hypothetical protein
MQPVTIDDILQRVPDRAQLAYTNLITHRDSVFDDATGWSYAYLTQRELACEMGVAYRTAQRALVDLREVGLVRVLAWPTAQTETHIRVADIDISSVFGPIRAMQEQLPREEQIDWAIQQLRRYFDYLDEAEGVTDASTGGSSACAGS